ncbi:MAG: PEGA domain-containing protein [Lachnospiraceae bacterium]|nr:PEGA domain-containing protein [Lachnospiraceae bacterium]
MFIRVCGGRKKSEKFVSTKGTISVTTNITGAAVEIYDGPTLVTTGSTMSGKTYTSKKIPNGTYVVTVSKDGYKNFTQTATVNGDDFKIDALLETVDAVKAELKGAHKVNDTQVQVDFTNKIDVPTKDNFSIEGLTIEDAKLTDDQQSVVLTVKGMELDKTYTVKTTNIVDINGRTVADGTADFVARKIQYKVDIKAYDVKTGENVTQIKSDGESTAKFVVTLYDDAGNVVKDKAEVRFTTTAGNFAETKVSAQSGVASNIFTSEISSTDKDALITATVVESDNKDLINLNEKMTLRMSPEDKDNKGASLTDVMVETCDRVILYFNKDVNATDYTKNTKDHKYEYDDSKMEIKIADNAGTKETVDDYGREKAYEPMALVPVEGNTKALCAILNTDDDNNDYLTDNAKAIIEVKDKTKAVPTTESKSTIVKDIRTPSMLSVKKDGLRRIKITFSEPIQNKNNKGSAEDESKWVIDNVNLTDKLYGSVTPATAIVGKFDVDTGVDERNVVTIELGTKEDENGKEKKIYFKAGKHSVQGNKIGDWANVTDTQNNIINTQTLDFVIEADETKPTADVTVESPEQYYLKFTTPVDINTLNDELKLQQKQENGEWKDIDRIDIRAIDKTDDKEYIVELNEDWTKILKTFSSDSKKNYYNYDFRLHMDKEKIENESNGKLNDEINLSLNCNIMKTPDVTSAELGNVSIDDGKVKINISEPIYVAEFGRPDTPTDKQGDSVVSPSVEFISEGEKETIRGNIVEVSDHDNQIIVEPEKTITTGKWKVVVRNVSDDVGNTSTTLVKNDFVVDKPISSDFSVLWVVAVKNGSTNPINKKTNNSGDDIIYVKFNKQFKTYDGVENAGATTNYTVNGYSIPSDSKIESSVEGYSDKAVSKNNGYSDIIAIHLKEKTLTDSSNSINISKTLKSVEEDQLSNGGDKLLTARPELDETHNGGVFTWEYTTCNKNVVEKKYKTTNITYAQAQALLDDGKYSDFNFDGVTISDDTAKAEDRTLTLRNTSSVTFDDNQTKFTTLNINTNQTGNLVLENVKAGTVKVYAPNADVTIDNTKIKTGAVPTNVDNLVIEDILDGTLTLKNIVIGTVEVKDSNAGAIELNAGAEINDKFIINTSGKVNLTVNADSVKLPTTIDVQKACTINVVNNSTTTIALKVDDKIKADDITIKVSGTGAANVTAKGGVDDKVAAKPAKEQKVTFSKDEPVDGKQATPATTKVTVNTSNNEAINKEGKIKVSVGDVSDVEVQIQEGDTAENIAASIAEAKASFEGYKVSAEGTTLTFKSDATGSEVTKFAVTVDDSTDSLGVSFTPGAQTNGENATPGTASFKVTEGNVPGTVKVKVEGTEVSVSVAAYAKADKIAADIKDAINNNTTINQTYTASNNGATVTVSTKTNGKEAKAPSVEVSFL